MSCVDKQTKHVDKSGKHVDKLERVAGPILSSINNLSAYGAQFHASARARPLTFKERARSAKKSGCFSRWGVRGLAMRDACIDGRGCMEAVLRQPGGNEGREMGYTLVTDRALNTLR